MRNKQSEDLLQKIAKLSELIPNEVPDNADSYSRSTLQNSQHLTWSPQQYWTFAINAALMAQQLDRQQGACLKRAHQKVNRKIPSRKKLGVTAVEQQIQLDGMHQPPTNNNANDGTHLNQTPLTSLIIKQPHPSSTIITLKSNKHLRKPD